MKTNQIMIRGGGFVQRTKDGYFNATELLKYYNSKSGDSKTLGNFQRLDQTKDYIAQLKSEGIDRPSIGNKGKVEYLGTYMHPKLFIDFAMWLSVEFKSKVIDYVLDGLIKTRNDAGDYYNEMCVQLLETYIEVKGCKPPPYLFINEAKYIKQICGYDDRNESSEATLSAITTVQKFNTQLVKNKVGKESRKKQLKTLADSLN